MQESNNQLIYSFPIIISPCGESYVDYPISSVELKTLKDASKTGTEFSDIPELEDLYNRIMEKAKEKLEEDIDLTENDIDVDDLSYYIDFPDFFENR